MTTEPLKKQKLNFDTSNLPALDADWKKVTSRSSLLGKGVNGSVEIYEQKKDSKKQVAVKWLYEPQQEGAQMEIECMKAMRDCPYALRLLGVHTDGPTRRNVYLLCELCATSLKSYWIDYTGNPRASPARMYPASKVKEWMWQMCTAVAFLHQQGWMHRDIKPENFLVTDASSVKLSDFGLSCRVNKDQATMYQNPVATLFYRPPEILMQNDMHPRLQYDEKLDIWSLACVFAWMNTGKELFAFVPDNVLQLHVQLRNVILNTFSHPSVAKTTESDWPVYLQNYVVNLTTISTSTSLSHVLQHQYNDLGRKDLLTPDCLELLDHMLCLNPLKIGRAHVLIH